MDKKNIFMGLMMGAIGLWVLPIFIEGFKWLRIVGYVIMFIATIFFIVGDVIFKGFENKKYKDMTPEQIIDLKNKEIELEMKKMDMQIQLEKKKAELQKFKNQGKTKENMPDVLGNLSDMMIGKK